jgi:hypothetical protein
MSVHVLPTNDVIQHTVEEPCPCGPTDEPVKRLDGSVSWLIVHHSVDNREASERREGGCIRADKACRWRPATSSDANPDDLVCDGCGARQRPEFAAPVRQTNGEEKR